MNIDPFLLKFLSIMALTFLCFISLHSGGTKDRRANATVLAFILLILVLAFSVLFPFLVLGKGDFLQNAVLTALVTVLFVSIMEIADRKYPRIFYHLPSYRFYLSICFILSVLVFTVYSRS